MDHGAVEIERFSPRSLTIIDGLLTNQLRLHYETNATQLRLPFLQGSTLLPDWAYPLLTSNQKPSVVESAINAAQQKELEKIHSIAGKWASLGRYCAR